MSTRAPVVVGNDERAKQLASRLGLVHVEERPNDAPAILSEEGAPLALVGFVDGGPITLDLAAAAKARGGKRTDLARAIGVGKGVKTVVDATAGIGRDASALSAAGCIVTAVERSPILAALWGEAIPCASLPSLMFRHGEARDILLRAALLAHDARPHAVYLDPMFPPRTKSALVGKELRTVAGVLEVESLLGEPEADAIELLKLAKKAATRRVVVKRPKRAAPLHENPAHQFVGTTVRYDLYLV